MTHFSAAVLTISDKGARGERKDTSGPALCSILEERGWSVVHTAILPDEKESIQSALLHCTDTLAVNLVLTTGGTGFSPRDITPEATMELIQRPTPGIPEAMRAKSMQVTPRGCLSRAAAGIRGRTLMVNLPGSEKAARENLLAVLDALEHGLDMLLGSGSADCGEPPRGGKQPPSMDEWLREAKRAPDADKVGMYLTHNGVVRQTAKAAVREGREDTLPVAGLLFSYDAEKVNAAIEDTRRMPGIYHVRVWLNEGHLRCGDDIMYVLIGGDIRPRTIDALQYLVGRIKGECVSETELSNA